MAEAAVESPAARFFCHKCSLEISPVLPDYTCPRCQGGFIEEVAQPSLEPSEESDDDIYGHGSDNNEEADALNQVADLWNMLTYIRRPDDQPVNFMQSSSGSSSQDGREGRYMSRPGPSRRNRYIRVQGRRPNQDLENARTRTEGFLQQLVNTLSENTGMVANASFPVFLNLHSNPGDYAWGRGGWNAIITQLINQLDGTGPPPLPKEKIDEIPTVNICQDQVDKNLQCTVCMEDFEAGEPVRRLACDHHFHNNCIIPWLELHGTCPICRKLLNDHSSQDNVFSSSSMPGPGTSQQNSDMTEPDSTSRRNDAYNPHVPSVYDFTEEYD
ncbi:E3 ubiquitin-protein ligase RNF115 like protein [Argiope bruennichi]|uniref:RING-type E3 ubiquitin transferase n=2 Tax=Argiope bruennichi TaxID=94029 RepID=A0A8T0ESM1_ARGBR|nr:E3 ubiquitin-protein ligase RNF115 like protein [Argiope bruennichi]